MFTCMEETGSRLSLGFPRDVDELFWDITRRRVAIVYWRFGTTDTLSRNVGKQLPHYAL
jgi:hypothetical protein